MKENLPTYQILEQTPKLLPTLYKDCAQPSVKKVGQALSTVFELSNTILLPLKLINEKAKLNFQNHIDNYKEKLNKVDSGKIIDVSTIIGTPIIDRLTYITNEEIANLFINLLAKASSSDTVNEAHPAFIHIIDRMTIDEARMIKYFSDKSFIPFINMITKRKDRPNEFKKLAWNLTGMEMEIELLCPKNIDTYLDNFSSLKIIEPQGALYKTDELIYSKIEEQYSDLVTYYNKLLEESKTEYNKIEIQKGFYDVTELGRAFIKSVDAI
jgi:hypothetical protein